MTAPQPYLDDGDVRLHHGDALDVLRGMDAGSVDCVVTSPPYWSLRDYQTEGQLGLEETPDQYVARLVDVFREVRRVLAPHGTCWVNLGDSYAANGAIADAPDSKNPRAGAMRVGYRGGGIKAKDLVGIPWRVAFALQADGWWLRSDIIWAKPNPMPESVTDRPTKSHEYVFLLTKQPRYWFDQEAVREGYDEGWAGRLDVGQQSRGRIAFGTGSYSEKARGPDGRRITRVLGQDGSEQHRDGERWPNAGRNVRSVWTIATQPYPEAHFATYPEELVRRCVLAGSPERVCQVCGEPSTRQVDVSPMEIARSERTHDKGHTRSSGTVTKPRESTTVGWSDCGHNDWRPGRVLDPFVGSGTTCLVARNHGRHSVGIDLNEQYLALAATRLQQLSLLSEPALSPTGSAEP